jgi:hypothetical protein
MSKRCEDSMKEIGAGRKRGKQSTIPSANQLGGTRPGLWSFGESSMSADKQVYRQSHAGRTDADSMGTIQAVAG